MVRPPRKSSQTRDPDSDAASGASAVSADDGAMRIAKAMARAGLCSRRDAERWIAEGRVMLNGVILTTPAVTVEPKDRIEVDGQPLRKPEPARLWRYHKPRGRVTTHRDPEERPTVFEALPHDMPRVVSIGRLDFNTEGLLLVTTNGGLARHLELPSTGWLRRYRVRAHGTVAPEALVALADGVEVDGVHYGPVLATLDRQQGSNVWLSIGLREGKNREVRKILSTLGLEVTRLIRLSFGPFALGDLGVGAVEEVPPRVIAEQVGARMAAELGLRFASAADGQRSVPAPVAEVARAGTRSRMPDPKRTGAAPPASAAEGLALGRRPHHGKPGPASARAKPPGSKRPAKP